ncbi:MAG TPA: fibronectin type III-like domain-contianing protein [Propionibacteriaceae bacterium]
MHRPVRELKGFAKVAVPAGGPQTVTVHLDQRAFAFWSTRLRRWLSRRATS